MIDSRFSSGVPDEAWEILPEESTSVGDGILAIGGVPVTELAAEFGTPLHIIDEAGLRRQMRRFVSGLQSRWPNSEVIFASKALPILAMYALAAEEGLSIDVAGGGELALALAAGVSAERLYFHGNAKTDTELRMALDASVGTIVIDNFDELDRLEHLLTRPQRLLLRVIPGVDPETHPSQATGGDDSKFGLPITQALEAIERMRSHSFMRFEGIHVHIGSQILDPEPFGQAVERVAGMGDFTTYDVGGGLGIKYTYSEQPPTVGSYLDAITTAAERLLPPGAKLLIEPGRSIVGRSGVTLYRTVSVKRTGRTFLAVDGGMADQLDIALTGQRYEAIAATRLAEPWHERMQVVGRQCESGDLLVDGAVLPTMKRDELLVLPATGAYSYTLSNNYNGALRPAIVFVRDGRSRLVARRENYEDLLRLHEPAIAHTQ